MTNNKTLHNFIRGGVNLKLSILVIVALIAMMSVACKNKVTGMSEFAIESEQIGETPKPESKPDSIKEDTGITQFAGSYLSATQEIKIGGHSAQYTYTATVDANGVKIKSDNANESEHQFTAEGTGSNYKLSSANPYNMTIGGNRVYTHGGTAAFDAEGYLTIVFDWGGSKQTIQFGKQASN